MNNFVQRTVTGLLFVIVILGSLYLDAIGFALLFLVMLTGSLQEFYILLHRNKYSSYKKIGVITGIALFVFAFLDMSFGIQTGYGWLVLLYLLIPASMLFDKTAGSPLTRFAVTNLGFVYIALPLTLANYMAFYTGTYHSGILMAFFILLWTNDTFAYLSGLVFGRTKLIERISPKKTWEGLIGGGLATVGLSQFIENIFSIGFNQMDWSIIAVLIVIAGNLGDLTESVIKRTLKVKDSGKVFPGHGGFLDRFDSILLALPAVFAYLFIFKQ